MNHDSEKVVYLNNADRNGNDRSLNKNFRRQPDNIESNLTASELVKMPFKEVIQILFRAGFEDKENGYQYKGNNNNVSRRWNDDRDIDYRGKNDHSYRGDRDHRGRGRGDFKRGQGRDQGRGRGDRGGFHDGGRDRYKQNINKNQIKKKSKFEHDKNNGWPNGNSDYSSNKNNQLESWGMQKKSISPQKIEKKNWWDISSVEKPIQD